MAETIPTEILDSYAIEEDAVATKLSGGLVNETLLVEDEWSTTVLQKLSPIFPPTVIEDMEIVSQHLTHKGWEVPKAIETKDGRLYSQDASGSLWRRTSYIASDRETMPDHANQEVISAAGKLIGRWQTDMSDLDKGLKFSLPHFHDTDYYAEKLYSYLPELPDPATYTLASELLSTYFYTRIEPTKDERLIHADPKLTNMLFRDGKPFTLIDFDTVMRGSQWIDCGDFLRSLSSRMLNETGLDTLQEGFVEGYYVATETGVSLDEAQKKAREATGKIALTLGFRYVCDILEESYFEWDRQAYESRRDNHIDRAEIQLHIARYATR